MLRAKIAVEAAGVLPDDQASEVIYNALKTGNYWIMETAIRAARNVRNMTADSSALIRRHIWELSDTDILRKRRDYSDLFRLNPTFRTIPTILNAKALVSACQWPIRIFAVSVLSWLYLYSILAVLYVGLTYLAGYIAHTLIASRHRKGADDRARVVNSAFDAMGRFAGEVVQQDTVYTISLLLFVTVMLIVPPEQAFSKIFSGPMYPLIRPYVFFAASSRFRQHSTI